MQAMFIFALLCFKASSYDLCSLGYLSKRSFNWKDFMYTLKQFQLGMMDCKQVQNNRQ